MNRIVLLGNLTRDPELSATPNGIEKCTFTVACQRRMPNKDGQREADFFRCTAWRNTAVFISKYFHKGDKMALEGSVQIYQYDKGGEKRTAYDVQVDNAEFCSSKSGGLHVQPDEHSAAPDDEVPMPWEP